MRIMFNIFMICRCWPARQLLVISGASIICGHCGHVVYADATHFCRHHVRCLGDGTASWWSTDFQAEVHHCGVDVEAISERDLQLLITSAADHA